MSSTTQTRQPTRSSLNANFVDHSELEIAERANRAKNSKKGKVTEKKQQTAVALGHIAWDQMFVVGLVLATTSFMKKLSRTISEECFQSIKMKKDW